MRPEDLIHLLRADPFIPFTIHMTDGTHYDIFHPAFVLVDRSRATIGLPTNQSPDRPAERTVFAALLHMVRCEPIEPKVRVTRRS